MQQPLNWVIAGLGDLENQSIFFSSQEKSGNFRFESGMFFYMYFPLIFILIYIQR